MKLRERFPGPTRRRLHQRSQTAWSSPSTSPGLSCTNCDSAQLLFLLWHPHPPPKPSSTIAGLILNNNTAHMRPRICRWVGGGIIRENHAEYIRDTPKTNYKWRKINLVTRSKGTLWSIDGVDDRAKVKLSQRLKHFLKTHCWWFSIISIEKVRKHSCLRLRAKKTHARWLSTIF